MVQVEEAYVHQVAVVDIAGILALLEVEDNFEEDTEDVHSAVPLEADEDCKSTIQVAHNISVNTYK